MTKTVLQLANGHLTEKTFTWGDTILALKGKSKAPLMGIANIRCSNSGAAAGVAPELA